MKPIFLMRGAPQIEIVGEFLTASECLSIIRCASARMQPSPVMASGGNAFEDSRTSTGMFFERGELPLIAELEQRLSNYFHFPIENGEGLQVLRYTAGQQYKAHHDHFDATTFSGEQALQRGGQRVATVLMYLNTPTGGVTDFPDAGATVYANEGVAVCFRYEEGQPRKSLHAGTPVEDGEKWVATKWVRKGRF